MGFCSAKDDFKGMKNKMKYLHIIYLTRGLYSEYEQSCQNKQPNKNMVKIIVYILRIRLHEWQIAHEKILNIINH